MIHHLKKVQRTTWIKAALGIVLLLVLFLVGIFGSSLNALSFDRIISWVHGAQANSWTLFIFAAAFSLGVLALPITIFPVISGVLFSFWVAFPINVVAATFGAWIAFALARYFGRDAVETFLRGRFKSFDRLTANQGVKTVVLMRWLGVPPFMVANYALGLSGVRTRDYVVGTALGIAPWMALVTYLANSLWQAAIVGGEKGLAKAVMIRMGPLMIISVVVAVGLGISMYLKRKKSLKEGTPPA